MSQRSKRNPRRSVGRKSGVSCLGCGQSFPNEAELYEHRPRDANGVRRCPVHVGRVEKTALERQRRRPL